MHTRRKFIRQTAAIGALGLAGVQAASQTKQLTGNKKAAPLSQTVKDAGMQLCLYMNPGSPRVPLARQMAVGAASSISAVDGAKPWEKKAILALMQAWEREGISCPVIEGPPSLGPKTKLGLPGRDEEIENFILFMKNLREVTNINVIGYGWQVLSWPRTDTAKQGRGGALVTAFDYEKIKNAPLTEWGEISMDAMWKSLEYFLKAVIPAAEKYGMKLAMHPTDPVIENIQGIARNMITVEAFKRMIDFYPSPSNGVTFCQGNFALMDNINLIETIRYFGKRNLIHYVHFRNVRGNKFKFEETFHDEGIINMHDAMQAYYETGFRGPVRPDHVPTMAGDTNNNPGYTTLGTMFPIGYIRGLMESVSRQA